LIKAIPFVAVFVSIVLAFIFVIVAIALALHGRVPERSYRPIEGRSSRGLCSASSRCFPGLENLRLRVRLPAPAALDAGFPDLEPRHADEHRPAAG